MKLITRDTDYAIRAICCIAKKNDKTVSAEELVKELCMPRPFLRKILQALNKKGLVRSYKGKGGGFRLGTPPDKIRIAGIAEVFQGPFKLNECTFKNKACPNKSRCPFKKKIDDLGNYVELQLRKITIASLIKERN